MTNVLVSRKRNINVTLNQVGSIIEPVAPVSLQISPTLGTTKSRLDKLDDVVPTGETNGASLVYDAATDKYIVEKINLANVVGDLDGGEF